MMDHVVDQHDDLAVDDGHVAARWLAVVGPQVEVVAVARYVEPPKWHVAALEHGEQAREALCQHVAFADDPDKDHVFGSAIALDDLVRNP